MGAPKTWEEAAASALDECALGSEWLPPRACLDGIDSELDAKSTSWEEVATYAYTGWQQTGTRHDLDMASLKGMLVSLLASKQHDYGHSNIERYGEQGVKIRVSDKVCRLRNLLDKDADAANESIEDTWLDIIGYSVIAIMLANGTFSLPLADDVPIPRISVIDSRSDGARPLADEELWLILAPLLRYAGVKSVHISWAGGHVTNYRLDK